MNMTSMYSERENYSMLIGNLTWWTNEDDVRRSLHHISVYDCTKILFFIDRFNGLSKGFVRVVVLSLKSKAIIAEQMPSLIIKGRRPIVSLSTREAYIYFDDLYYSNRVRGCHLKSVNFLENDSPLKLRSFQNIVDANSIPKSSNRNRSNRNKKSKTNKNNIIISNNNKNDNCNESKANENNGKAKTKPAKTTGANATSSSTNVSTHVQANMIANLNLFWDNLNYLNNVSHFLNPTAWSLLQQQPSTNNNMSVVHDAGALLPITNGPTDNESAIDLFAPPFQNPVETPAVDLTVAGRTQTCEMTASELVSLFNLQMNINHRNKKI